MHQSKLYVYYMMRQKNYDLVQIGFFILDNFGCKNIIKMLYKQLNSFQ